MGFLNKIPKDIVETLKLYRLGFFQGKSYEILELESKIEYPQHFHKKSQANFHIILGKGKIILNGKSKAYKKGDSFLIPVGLKHGFLPEKHTLILTIQNPPIRNPKTKKEDIHF